MDTISVNFERLTEEERKQLLTLVEKANKPEPWWAGTKFDIAKGGHYYFVGCTCRAEELPNNEDRWDKWAIKNGNACKDKAYIERRAQEIKLYNLMSNFAEVMNDGWVPNWNDTNENKFYCVYLTQARKWDTSHYNSIHEANAVYFKSQELAQRCIDEIILPFENGKL